MVYATRPHCRPEDFARLFAGDVARIYLPRMVRRPSPADDLAALLALVRIFREARPDVVHAHSSKAGFLARCAALFSGVPRVFYSSHGYAFRMEDAGWAARASYFLLELAASRIGRIIVNAPNEVRCARILAWPKAVFTAFNALDVSAYVPRYQEGAARLRVAACGRLTAAKRPEAFVRLCRRLEQSYPDLDCVWIGDGEGREAFLESARRLVVRNLKVTGWLEPMAVKEELAKADVVVHYSRWDVLPGAVSEAMALGKPVVGSRAVDQIEDGVNGYVADDEAALFENLRRLLDSSTLRRKLGLAARRTVEKRFDFPSYIRRLEAIYLGEADAA